MTNNTVTALHTLPISGRRVEMRHSRFESIHLGRRYTSAEFTSNEFKNDPGYQNTSLQKISIAALNALRFIANVATLWLIRLDYQEVITIKHQNGREVKALVSSREWENVKELFSNRPLVNRSYVAYEADPLALHKKQNLPNYFLPGTTNPSPVSSPRGSEASA